jgi:beta-glucosidase
MTLQNPIDPLCAIRSRALASASQIQQVLNNNATDQVAITAAAVDVAMVFVHAYSTEGEDRNDLSFSANGKAVIDAAIANNNNTILVLFNPGAVDIAEYASHPNVTAILAAGLSGEQAGPALARIIYGDVSPSGKLPFTMGKSISDYPPNGIDRNSIPAPEVNFSEGVFIDYRWFDEQGTKPVYGTFERALLVCDTDAQCITEFGYGLSYSKFSYSGLSLNRKYQKDQTSIQLTNENFVGKKQGDSIYDVIAEVSVDVKNVGKVLACEVAQLVSHRCIRSTMRMTDHAL